MLEPLVARSTMAWLLQLELPIVILLCKHSDNKPFQLSDWFSFPNPRELLIRPAFSSLQISKILIFLSTT
jgi:hypothetical protein